MDVRPALVEDEFVVLLQQKITENRLNGRTKEGAQKTLRG